jgi:outer membrane protein assembly factor BamB
LGVVAVAVKDGGIHWSRPIMHGAGPCAMVKSKGLVAVGGNDGFVYGLGAKTGETRWKTNILADAPPDPPGFSGTQARVGDSLSRPTGVACDEETIYQSIFDQSRIVALDADTGALKWSYQAGGWVYGAPTVGAEYVLVGSQDKLLHCLEKGTGKCVWKFPTKGRIEAGGTLDDRSMFFGSCDGGYYRVNLADGKQLWKFETDPGPDGRRPIYSVPIVTADALYFAAGEGQVYALDKETGKLRWKLRAAEDSELFCSPASDGERLFIVTRPVHRGTGFNALVAIGPR